MQTEQQFTITGMTCSACTARVEKAVSTLKGVHEVNVNLLKNDMLVSFDQQRLQPNEIIQAVSQAGYKAQLAHSQVHQTSTTSPTPVENETSELFKQFIISGIFTALLMVMSLSVMYHIANIDTFFELHPAVFAFTQFLIALPVLAINANYFKSGFKNLMHLAANMDSLIAIGCTAAIVSGIFSLYRIAIALEVGNLETANKLASNLYFESAVMILTLVTLGRLFESRAKKRTTKSLEQLLALVPKTALRLENGQAIEVCVDQIMVGDILIVKAGQRIASDGVITQGHAFIDESAVTGESVAVEKQASDTVTGACVCQSGYFQMRVTRIGENTTIAQIIKLVDQATSSKAPIARIADKISGIFVPVVMSLAFITSLVWLAIGEDLSFAINAGISVLVISCPCALGLATPTAIMVGSGLGAHMGILFKSAQAIEKIHGINTVVFDKTGTLTQGRPTLTDIVYIQKLYSEQKLFSLIVALEKASEHPLSRAFVEYASTLEIIPMNVSKFQQIPGKGILAQIDNIEIAIGNEALIKQYKLIVCEPCQQKVLELSKQGKTVLYICINNSVIAIIAVADLLRPSAQTAIKALHEMHINTIMLTGDNERTAQAIAKKIGIDTVIAQVLPQDKQMHIQQLQQQGHCVAMVGDGINDAPALAAADIGIALANATDIAVESADTVLMHADIGLLVHAITLGKSVVRTIKMGLFWAFIYNLIGIPIAAGILYPSFGVSLSPMIAAAAMSMSSVCVVMNALRLRRFKPIAIAQNTPLNETTEKIEISFLNVPILQEEKSMKTIIKVDAMNCSHCQASVERALSAVPGVLDVFVSLENKQATITTEKMINESTLKTVIENAGFIYSGIQK